VCSSCNALAIDWSSSFSAAFFFASSERATGTTSGRSALAEIRFAIERATWLALKPLPNSPRASREARGAGEHG
jgi:hypothetical protein